MNRITIISIVTLVTLATAACGSGNRNKQKSGSPVQADQSVPTADQTLPTGDNSMVSLDWQGIYTGTTPCADCEGILTLVKLNSDLSYIHKTKYLGKDETIFGTTGNFAWSDDGSTVTLIENTGKHTDPSFLVGENILFMLDSEGKRVTGVLEEMYKLHKVTASIEGHSWVLTAIEGVEVSDAGFPDNKPWIMFDSAEKRVTGFAGCNRLSGFYSGDNSSSISFSAMATTKIACPAMQSEQMFLAALNKTTGYKVTPENLILTGENGGELARFEADFFEGRD